MSGKITIFAHGYDIFRFIAKVTKRAEISFMISDLFLCKKLYRTAIYQNINIIKTQRIKRQIYTLTKAKSYIQC